MLPQKTKSLRFSVRKNNSGHKMYIYCITCTTLVKCSQNTASFERLSWRLLASKKKERSWRKTTKRKGEATKKQSVHQSKDVNENRTKPYAFFWIVKKIPHQNFAAFCYKKILKYQNHTKLKVNFLVSKKYKYI